MAEIANYPKYLWANDQVISKDRHFPLTPRVGKYAQFFLEDSNGNTRFVSVRELKSRVVTRLEKSKRKGRLMVTHVSGQMYGSLKEARQATGLSDAKLKSNPEYTISSYTTN